MLTPTRFGAAFLFFVIAASAPLAYAQEQDDSPPAEAPRSQGKRINGQTITVTGHVQDEPRFHSADNGNNQSWTFTMSATTERRHGDEFLSVTFYTVKAGKDVGVFKLKKGEEATLTGTFHSPKSERKGAGVIGSLYVNDLSVDEITNMH
jgi:hypothetical protein